MSFSSEQKNFIMNGTYKSQCCRRALLSGMLFSKGKLTQEGIEVSFEKRETAEFFLKLVAEFYSERTEIFYPDKGGRRVACVLKTNSARKYIENLENNGNLFDEKCQNCRSSFLRGVFLGAGRISDPQKTYTLEFSLGERSESFSSMLAEMELSPKRSDKGGGVVYFRNSQGIEDFLAHSGLNGAMFSVIEAKFNGEAKRNVHRVTNCYTNNIKKTVDAASPQLEIIRKLVEANLLSSLPDELEATAILRLENPDLSLSQLSAISVPKVSKPGLSHRLKKIMELGETLLHKKSN